MYVTRSPLLSTLAAALLVAAAPAQAKEGAEAVELQIDKGHSSVGFSVRHLGISKVTGEFKDFGGTIHADPETGKLTKVIGVVQAGSVDTGIEGRDNHLKADDFFAAEAHPEMRLETTNIKWIGDRFTARTNMTIRGNTHPVLFSGELIGAGKFNLGKPSFRAGFSAKGKISREKFGLKFNRLAEGVAVVGDEVTINLEVEASRPLP